MIIKQSKDFVPAPEGVHSAVCVDVVDLGLVETTWQGKTRKSHKLRLVWEIDAKMDDGKPFLVSNRYTASLDQKSNLRKVLKTWRGRDFTKDELDGFEMETIISAPCQVVISHTDKEGTIYANVESVIKAGATKLAASGNYKRVKDREDENGHGESQVHGDDMANDDIPF